MKNKKLDEFCKVNLKKCKVKKHSKLLYFCIYNDLNKGKNLQEIIQKYSISRQLLNYHLKTLQNRILLNKSNYKNWKITPKKHKKKCKVSTPYTPPPPANQHKEIRGHNFMFLLEIPGIENWENREKIFKKRKLEYKRIVKLNKLAQRFIINGRNVHLHDNSIIVYENESFIGLNATETKTKAIKEFLNIISSIESLLNVSFKIDNKYKWKISRAHYSIMKNELAKDYNKKKKKLSVIDDDNKVFLNIDNSLNLNELETIKPRESEQDNLGIQEYFRSHKRTGYKVTPEYLLDTFIPLVMDLNENIKGHMQAIRGINASMKDFNKNTKYIKKVLDQKKLNQWI